jgi:competence protein ComEA
MSYFYFTKKERRALLLSSLVIAACMLALVLWREEPLALELFLNDKEEAIVQRMTGAAPMKDRVEKNNTPSAISTDGIEAPADEPESAIAPKPFDPNTADLETLVKGGLPERVAQTIINYREKGGRFYRKEDLKKIFIMTEPIYQKIEDYVQIAEQAKDKKSDKAITIDINQADEESWKLLPGIGTAYAARICKFRASLGGFYALEQVAETYGLPDTVFQKIKPRLQMSNVIRRLEINRLPPDSLAKHPYIDFKQAGLLVNYRKHHGPYKTIEKIAESKAFSFEQLQRIAPYLDFGAAD